MVKVTRPHNKDSRVLSMLAAAMWRVDPEAFASLRCGSLQNGEPGFDPQIDVSTNQRRWQIHIGRWVD
jgi:hypothetical protein